MWQTIKAFLVGKLDYDKNGKVNLADAEAKFGQAVVRAFLIGACVWVPVGFVLAKFVK